MVIFEKLVKSRVEILKLAKGTFGKNNSWTKEVRIYVKVGERK